LALRPGQVLTANYREAALARKPVFVALQIETREAYRSVLKNVADFMLRGKVPD